MADVSTITANSIQYNIKDATARQMLENMILRISVPSFTNAFPAISNADITSDHVVLEMTFSNPTAINSDIAWTTGNGTLTLSGTVSGTTTAQITLGKAY